MVEKGSLPPLDGRKLPVLEKVMLGKKRFSAIEVTGKAGRLQSRTRTKPNTDLDCLMGKEEV